MLAVERQSSILEALEGSDSVSVAELSRLFSVSEETIRRDLDKLMHGDSTIVRVHGGAYKIKTFDKEAPYHLRETLMVAEKQRIAGRSYSLLTRGDTIMLDSSTTALYLARIIKQNALQLSVITNSLAIATELCNCSSINLVVTGGSYRASSCSFTGYATTGVLESYYADSAFVSCSGLHPEMGLTDNHEGEAQVRRLMLSNAGKKYLLIDSEKLGRCKTNRICSLKGIDTIFTDAMPAEHWIRVMDSFGVELVCC